MKVKCLEEFQLDGKENSCKLILVALHASMAQLVEQLTCNQQVVGSSPTRGSKDEQLSLS